MNAIPPKERIKQELLRQLGQSEYRAITITGLVASLDMSRQNLYKHFASKDEILQDLIQDQLEAFFDVFEAFYEDRSPDKWASLIRRLLDVIQQHRDLIRKVLRDDTEKMVFDNLKSAVNRALGHVARVNGIVIEDQAYFEMIAFHIAGSSYHVARSWVFFGEDVSAEKAARLLGDLFNDGILTKLKLCAPA